MSNHNKNQENKDDKNQQEPQEVNNSQSTSPVAKEVLHQQNSKSLSFYGALLGRMKQ